MTKPKYHFIYKTTFLTNGKYYIGMHSTYNLDDGYLGSGRRLKWMVNRYGKENFKFEILEYLVDRASLSKREAEIVTRDLLLDSKCLNLIYGGQKGFGSMTTAQRKVNAIKGHKLAQAKSQGAAFRDLVNRKKRK